jgi:hypothetical protein
VATGAVARHVNGWVLVEEETSWKTESGHGSNWRGTLCLVILSLTVTVTVRQTGHGAVDSCDPHDPGCGCDSGFRFCFGSSCRLGLCPWGRLTVVHA